MLERWCAKAIEGGPPGLWIGFRMAVVGGTEVGQQRGGAMIFRSYVEEAGKIVHKILNFGQR